MPQPALDDFDALLAIVCSRDVPYRPRVRSSGAFDVEFGNVPREKCLADDRIIDQKNQIGGIAPQDFILPLCVIRSPQKISSRV